MTLPTGATPAAVWARVRAGKTTYYQAKFPFSQGHFHLRVFGNGTWTYAVDVNPPGLDLRGLFDLGARIVSEVYALTGKHVSFDDLMVHSREFNVDSADPELRQLLQLSGAKAAFAYSQLLETGLRIYEKSPSSVRVETVGKNALQLMQALRSPISIMESLSRLPDQVNAVLDEHYRRVDAQMDVLSKGTANIFQQQQRQNELLTRLISTLEVAEPFYVKIGGKIDAFISEVRGFIEELRRDRANLNDAVEVLLVGQAARDRLNSHSETGAGSETMNGKQKRASATSE